MLEDRPRCFPLINMEIWFSDEKNRLNKMKSFSQDLMTSKSKHGIWTQIWALRATPRNNIRQTGSPLARNAPWRVYPPGLSKNSRVQELSLLPTFQWESVPASTPHRFAIKPQSRRRLAPGTSVEEEENTVARFMGKRAKVLP